MPITTALLAKQHGPACDRQGIGKQALRRGVALDGAAELARAGARSALISVYRAERRNASITGVKLAWSWNRKAWPASG
jgi:hypothetical protein